MRLVEAGEIVVIRELNVGIVNAIRRSGQERVPAVVHLLLLEEALGCQIQIAVVKVKTISCASIVPAVRQQPWNRWSQSCAQQVRDRRLLLKGHSQLVVSEPIVQLQKRICEPWVIQVKRLAPISRDPGEMAETLEVRKGRAINEVLLHSFNRVVVVVVRELNRQIAKIRQTHLAV